MERLALLDHADVPSTTMTHTSSMKQIDSKKVFFQRNQVLITSKRMLSRSSQGGRSTEVRHINNCFKTSMKS